MTLLRHTFWSVCCIILAMQQSTSALAQSPFASPGEPLDYDLLSQKLVLELLRAGNHDESGVNDYYFTVQLYGLINSAEERNLSLENRKKVPLDLGTFGSTKLEALSIWRPDAKAKDTTKELAISGQQIREIVARTMASHKTSESNVVVMVNVSMFETEKRFWFFGEDRFVTQSHFYPIPSTLFETPFRTNTSLILKDDTGTEVRIAVVYDKPAKADERKSDSAKGANTSARSTPPNDAVNRDK